MLKACEEGVSEVWLTSEDTGAYGRDIGTNIVELMILLISHLPKDKMLRVGMTNPPYILEHLEGISHIMNHPQVFTFLHIPVQAGNDACLERMNREYTVAEFEKVCDYLLANVKDMAISTDIICGFPGETEEEFLGTLENLNKYKFPAVNISQFYARPGTVAARMIQVPTKDKKDRSRRVTSLFEGYKNLDYMMGRVERVQISEREPNNKHNGDIMIGHTKNYTKIILPYNPELMGKSVTVKIEKALKWHVEGLIVEEKLLEVPNPQVYFSPVVKLYEERRLEKDRRQKERENERKNKLEKLKREQEEKRRALKAAEVIGLNRVEEVVTTKENSTAKNGTALLSFGASFIFAGVLLYLLGY